MTSAEGENIWQAFERVLKEHGPIEIKPDGYCAWHSEQGWVGPVLGGRMSCLEKMIYASGFMEKKYEEYFESEKWFIDRDVAIAKAKKSGWRVRAVRFVPMD